MNTQTYNVTAPVGAGANWQAVAAAHSPIGLALTTPDLIVCEGNPALAHLLGVTEDQLPGVSLLAATHADDRRLHHHPLNAVRHDGAAGYQLRHRLERPDGSGIWVDLHVAPAGDRSGLLVVQVADVSEQVHSVRHLRWLAHHDPLTGLANRALLDERLADALARSGRTGQFPSVLYIDLDGFKQLNDTHGHEAGDAALIDIGYRLRLLLRATDTVARLGGDEFAIVLDLAGTPAAAQRVAAGVHACLRARQQQHPDGLTASIGIASARAADTGRDVLRRADEALYRAKRSGRNRTVHAARDNTGCVRPARSVPRRAAAS